MDTGDAKVDNTGPFCPNSYSAKARAQEAAVRRKLGLVFVKQEHPLWPPHSALCPFLNALLCVPPVTVVEFQRVIKALKEMRIDGPIHLAAHGDTRKTHGELHPSIVMSSEIPKDPLARRGRLMFPVADTAGPLDLLHMMQLFLRAYSLCTTLKLHYLSSSCSPKDLEHVLTRFEKKDLLDMLKQRDLRAVNLTFRKGEQALMVDDPLTSAFAISPDFGEDLVLLNWIDLHLHVHSGVKDKDDVEESLSLLELHDEVDEQEDDKEKGGRKEGKNCTQDDGTAAVQPVGSGPAA